MSESKKISDQELNKLQLLVSEMNKIQTTVGDIEVRKHTLMHQHGELRNELVAIQKELQEKYGDVNINLTDGTIAAQEPKLEVQ